MIKLATFKTRETKTKHKRDDYTHIFVFFLVKISKLPRFTLNYLRWETEIHDDTFGYLKSSFIAFQMFSNMSQISQISKFSNMSQISWPISRLVESFDHIHRSCSKDNILNPQVSYAFQTPFLTFFSLPQSKSPHWKMIFGYDIELCH